MHTKENGYQHKPIDGNDPIEPSDITFHDHLCATSGEQAPK